jgi:nitroimidazol reductase NimA-like FMN-containing flavoprotein (pyridoxamine 5'-phosphate oxidase superfamily)
MDNFREVKRVKQALSKDACIEILKNEKRGVLAVTGDGGYPYPVPLNHYYCAEDGRLYFHSGKTGHKIDALKTDPKAAFCVTDGGEQTPGEWSLYFNSVIVFGRVEFITDYDEICRISRLLSLKFTDDEAYIAREIEKYGKNTALFALIPEHITGKRVHEE